MSAPARFAPGGAALMGVIRETDKSHSVLRTAAQERAIWVLRLRFGPSATLTDLKRLLKRARACGLVCVGLAQERGT
jgi:hypothetical protein